MLSGSCMTRDRCTVVLSRSAYKTIVYLAHEGGCWGGGGHFCCLSCLIRRVFVATYNIMQRNDVCLRTPQYFVLCAPGDAWLSANGNAYDLVSNMFVISTDFSSVRVF